MLILIKNDFYEMLFLLFFFLLGESGGWVVGKYGKFHIFWRERLPLIECSVFSSFIKRPRKRLTYHSNHSKVLGL